VVRFVLGKAEVCGGGLSVVALQVRMRLKVEDTDRGNCVAEIEAVGRDVAGECQG
jgi:hypothetical protein